MLPVGGQRSSSDFTSSGSKGKKGSCKVLNFLDLTKEFIVVVGKELKVEVSLGLAYPTPSGQGNVQVLGIIPLLQGSG